MRNTIILGIILIGTAACSNHETVIRLAVTTDVHGMIFPYNFISRRPADNSLAHICSYVNKNRLKEDTLFFLLDNGDFLQGQPTVYYYNFIDTLSTHLSATVMNHMGYAAGTVGNHDIETGPAVYNRVRSEFTFPWLAANVVSTLSGEPYLEPYTILKAGRKKIAVLGLITPGIPHWLPKNLWPGIEFRDMVETAGEWIPKIIEKEDPELVVGLFHSGTDAGYGGNTDAYLNDNAVLIVAEQVPGFDVIFAGHDHRVSIQNIATKNGDSVLVIDPGSHGRYAGELTVTFGKNGITELRGENISMKDYEPSAAFQELFSRERETVSRYLEDTITWLSCEMKGSDALFGPSSMMSLIHQVQLELTGADLSFTAPLSINTTLQKGPLLVSDLFKLYRFENMLYSMILSGSEIDGFLEHAAGIWFTTMKKPGDHLLQFSEDVPGRLANQYYNFSSAAGIDYTIDVSRDPGNRVSILGFTNGNPFREDEKYSVAINSYRGNGGGGHLTAGAGIQAYELPGRVSWSTDNDLRFHLMEYLGRSDTIFPASYSNWHCIPLEWAANASERDKKLFK
ncbi:MAG: bifunctional metallophosphatase/5'-nucleotidase [Bacteroidetes bacterium]|nr:bifunctional metallophosphatase/5'-nucleotidase [Bacteroidota bacterium]